MANRVCGLCRQLFSCSKDCIKTSVVRFVAYGSIRSTVSDETAPAVAYCDLTRIACRIRTPCCFATLTVLDENKPQYAPKTWKAVSWMGKVQRPPSSLTCVLQITWWHHTVRAFSSAGKCRVCRETRLFPCWCCSLLGLILPNTSILSYADWSLGSYDAWLAVT